jgi:hypothetical protein
VIGTASIPFLSVTDRGRVQMQQNSASGKIERRRVRMAISVLSFPVFGVPKWPKKLIFTRAPLASSVVSGSAGSTASQVN